MKDSPTRRWLPSPALVISLVALFVALGGTGYAVTQLPKNSVGTTQLKNNAVTTAKVANGSLLRGDFKAGQLPAGPTGPAGPAGAAGAAGPAGPAGVVGGTIVYRDNVDVADGQYQEEFVRCENGKTALSGGANISNGAHGDAKLNVSRPTDDAGVVLDNGSTAFKRWKAGAYNPAGGDATTFTLRVWVICAA